MWRQKTSAHSLPSVRATATLICVLLFPAQTTAGVNVTQVPLGTLSYRTGEIRLLRAQYDLVIIRQSPMVYRQNLLLPMVRKLRNLMTEVKAQDPDLGTMYEHRLYEYTQDHQRSKRGLFNFFGDLASSLFGVATQGQVDELSSKVNEITDTMGETTIAVNDLTVCLDQTIKQQIRITDKVNELTDQISVSQRELAALRESVTNLTHYIKLNSVGLLIEAALSLLEDHKRQESYALQMYELRRDLVEIGHLTETLLDNNSLRRVREKIHIELSDEYLYSNLPVSLIKLDRDRIGYWVSIPILDGEAFTGWRIATVPTLLPHGQGVVEPEAYAVGVGLKSGNIIELDECMYTNPMLCRSPLEHIDLPCVRGIITKNRDLLEKCIVNEVKTLGKVKRISNNILLLSTEGENIETRCPQVAGSKSLDPGTFLLGIENGCTVQSAAGWLFESSTVLKDTIKINDLIMIELPNVSLTVPVLPTVPVFNVSHVDYLVQAHYGNLPKPITFRSSYITFTGSIMGISSLCILFVIIFGVVVYYLYKRRVCLKKHNKSEEAKSPMLEMKEITEKEPSAPPVTFGLKYKPTSDWVVPQIYPKLPSDQSALPTDNDKNNK